MINPLKAAVYIRKNKAIAIRTGTLKQNCNGIKFIDFKNTCFLHRRFLKNLKLLIDKTLNKTRKFKINLSFQNIFLKKS